MCAKGPENVFALRSKSPTKYLFSRPDLNYRFNFIIGFDLDFLILADHRDDDQCKKLKLKGMLLIASFVSKRQETKNI